MDQNGTEGKLMQHGNQDGDRQALFLKPSDEATSGRLTFVVQRSRFVQFLARPEFAGGP